MELEKCHFAIGADISHRLVHAILQVRLGGEDFVGARRAQRFGHLPETPGGL